MRATKNTTQKEEDPLQEQPNQTVPTVSARRLTYGELIKTAGSIVAISAAALSVFCVSMFSFAGQQPVAQQTNPVSGSPTIQATSASATATPSNLTGIPHTFREVRMVSVPFKTHMKMSHNITPGSSEINQHGKPGVKEQVFNVH